MNIAAFKLLKRYNKKIIIKKAKLYGLKTNGNKDEIIKRIVNYEDKLSLNYWKAISN